MARFIYSFVLYLLSPLIFIHLWLRGNKNPDYRKRWSERLALCHYDLSEKNSLVFHCASVGEVIAAAPLIKKLSNELSEQTIIITCNTPTGTEQIKRSFSGMDNIKHYYLPLDFHFTVKRFLNKLQPKLVCILETELWPNLIVQSSNRNIPVIVINARLSEKSFKGYQKISPLSHLIMKGITQLAAHNEQDANRFIQLGLAPKKVCNTGSIKFDIKIDENIKFQAAQQKNKLTHNQPIWIAGSTHHGEDELLLRTHKKLLESFPDALLILVPRHPERFDEVAELIRQENLLLIRKSEQEIKKCQVLLADTMGELLTLYGAADIAFIGGSLIERGGHNPLEACAYSVPVITGPHIFNFSHVYPELLKQGGCLMVQDHSELLPLLTKLFLDKKLQQQIGKQGALFVAENQGAVNKTLTILTSYFKPQG